MDLSSLARQFGLNEDQARAAMEALTPVLTAGLRRNTQDDSGFADLTGALAGGRHSRYVDDPAAFGTQDAIDDGNAILGHILGSKDVSRGVAQQLSATSGIGESILKKMLPVIAAMIMGQIAKKAFGGSGSSPGGGGLEDILGDLLGGGSPQAQTRQAPSGGGLGDILGDILGGAQDRQTPQRAPGGAGGLEDLLKDILGGGAGSAPAPQRREQVARGRKTLDEILGGGSSRGSAADDLLRSVEEALRRR